MRANFHNFHNVPAAPRLISPFRQLTVYASVPRRSIQVFAARDSSAISCALMAPRDRLELAISETSCNKRRTYIHRNSVETRTVEIYVDGSIPLPFCALAELLFPTATNWQPGEPLFAQLSHDFPSSEETRNKIQSR